MSREKPSTKKPRLVSEISQNSGITVLSNVTQTTDLSSDLDDNNSESSNQGLNDAQGHVNEMNHRKIKTATRKRRVSWNIDCDDDDDETFYKDATRVLPEKYPRQQQHKQKPAVPYDNNFNDTNNSYRRVRRATESCIDYHDDSLFQRLPHLNSPVRSQTTSQLQGREKEIQNQRLTEFLVKQHDAKSTMKQRRSQSATSLHSQNLIGQHMYESLPSQTSLKKINSPVETVVTMTNSGENYLHPTTETFVQKNKRFNRSLSNDPSVEDDSSSYADVNRGDTSSTGNQHDPVCLNKCNNSFFRKGFFVLLVLNSILILLNVVGLPFLFFAINSDGSEVDNRTTDMCLECEHLIRNANDQLVENGVIIKDSKLCCVKSADQLLPATLKLISKPPQEKTDSVPLVQLIAANISLSVDNTIVWKKREDLITAGTKVKHETTIVIMKTGYYYVYSRVHYKKEKGRPNNKLFTIGHSLIKKTRTDEKGVPIDTIVQRCFPSNSTVDIRHTNQLGSLHHLQEGDRLSIKLDHKTYYDFDKTIFGMFLVAT